MSGCKARQHSDQMLCPCGLAWDVNDPDPPECPQARVDGERRQFEAAYARYAFVEPARVTQARAGAGYALPLLQAAWDGWRMAKGVGPH